MKNKRGINAKAVVQDIRSGMTDGDLMERYRLSAKGLRSTFQKLLAARLITQAEYGNRLTDYEDTIILDFVPPLDE